MKGPYETIVRHGGSAAIQQASRFFMKADPAYESLRDITARLGKLGIPYAVMGGMALVAHGYRRTTEDVDILVTQDGLTAIHQSIIGPGYRPAFEGSKNVRDTRTGVRIEFVVAGQFPGDGKPKPIAFPDPQQVCVEIDGVPYVRAKFLELATALGEPELPAR